MVPRIAKLLRRINLTLTSRLVVSPVVGPVQVQVVDPAALNLVTYVTSVGSAKGIGPVTVRTVIKVVEVVATVVATVPLPMVIPVRTVAVAITTVVAKGASTGTMVGTLVGAAVTQVVATTTTAMVGLV